MVNLDLNYTPMLLLKKNQESVFFPRVYCTYSLFSFKKMKKKKDFIHSGSCYNNATTQTICISNDLFIVCILWIGHLEFLF